MKWKQLLIPSVTYLLQNDHGSASGRYQDISSHHVWPLQRRKVKDIQLKDQNLLQNKLHINVYTNFIQQQSEIYLLLGINSV